MNNNETTQILNRGAQQEQKNNGMSKAAFAAGGFVAGAAATAGINALANEKTGEEALPITPENETSATGAKTAAETETASATETSVAAAPAEQDVIVATDEGVRVAQVSDDKTFAEAFADARAQVGPGGVFEWHGKAYSTYYKEEWEQMSAQERAEYQVRVDYNDVVGEQHTDQYAHNDVVPQQPTAHPTAQQETIQAQQESGNDIRVLGVHDVTTAEGNTLTVAAVGNDHDGLLLVDVDQDGNFDAGWHDDNHDGVIQNSEIFDASGLPVTVNDLLQAEAQQNGTYYAADDGMPDYTNDADASAFI